MFKIFKITFLAVLLFIVVQEVYDFSRAHGGFGVMLRHFEDTVIITAQQMINGTDQIKSEVQTYFNDLH